MAPWVQAMPLHPMAMAKLPENSTAQLGEFGEGFGKLTYKLRGYDVASGQSGANGIDLIAIKRAPDGTLSDVRIVEVKTRTAGDVTELPETLKGRQLSDEWTDNALEKLANTNGPGADLAKEVQQAMISNPQIVQREAVLINVQADQVVTRAVTSDGVLGAVKSEQNVEPLLKRIQGEFPNEPGVAENLAKWDQIKATSAEQMRTGAAAETSDTPAEPATMGEPAATEGATSPATPGSAGVAPNAPASTTAADTAAEADGATATDTALDVAAPITAGTEDVGLGTCLLDAAGLSTPAGWAGAAVVIVAPAAVHRAINEFCYGQFDRVRPVTKKDLRWEYRPIYLKPLINPKYRRPLISPKYTRP